MHGGDWIGCISKVISVSLRQQGSIMRIIMCLFLFKRVASLVCPTNLPLDTLSKRNPNIVVNKLIPILESSIVESRVHLRGKGESLNLLELLKEEMLADNLKSVSPTWETIISNDCIGDSSKWTSLSDEVAESLFYHKISIALEANAITGNEATFDCFLDNKLSSLRKSQIFLEEISNRLPDVIMEKDPVEALKKFLLVSVWAMQGARKLICNDESITGTANKRRAFNDGLQSQMEYLALNDLPEVMKIFRDGGDGDVSIVLNNTGKELVADLALAYTLLVLNLCKTVTFHTKAYTVNRYGATNVDVYGHIEHLADPVHSSVWAVRHFGEALRAFINTGRIKIIDDDFWCLPTPLWEMPQHVESMLATSKLVIVKGDANYRRMLGSRNWPLSDKSALKYWHVPVCAIRVMETEIGCGFDEVTAKQATFNKSFMTSGRWGQIQFQSADKPDIL